MSHSCHRVIPIELCLLIEHFLVNAIIGVQLVMRAVLGDSATAEHRHLIRELHCGQTVGDQDRALVCDHIAELSVDLILGVGIERLPSARPE